MDAPAERPRIRVLMALPSLSGAHPRMTRIVDLLSVQKYKRAGFQIVAIDPEDRELWDAWRAKHPEVNS